MNALFTLLLFLSALALFYALWFFIFHYYEVRDALLQIINHHFWLEMVLVAGLLLMFSGVAIFISNDFVWDVFSKVVMAAGVVLMMPIFIKAIKQVLNKQ